MRKNNDKKIIIAEIIIAAVLILALAVAVVVDVFSSRPTVELDVQQAQSVVDDTFELLPFAGAVTSGKIVEETNITVLSVSSNGNRETVLTCEYSIVNILDLYNSNKDSLFAKAYDYSEEQEAAGNMVNAAKLRLYMDEQIVGIISDAEKVSGQAQISVFEISKTAAEGDIFAIPYEDTFFRVYLSDEMLNTMFGGLVKVSDDIKSTHEFNYNGETLSIARQNTLRNGLSECFALRNFSSAKPDTSSFFENKWNAFCDEFYRNFIKNAQWTYITNGLLTTLEITLLSALIGILIGFICAIIRVTRAKTGKLFVADQIVSLYLSVIRGTPLMVQLMIIYFVLLLPIGIEKFPAAVICFAINSGAYVAEIVRGGIMSVDNGQIEAGRSLGLNYIQTMYHIVVPQAFKAVLPSLANEFITLLKESSVAFYIGVADLTQGGLKIRSITYSNFMPLIAVALIYLVMVLVLTKLVGILERRLRKDER